MRRYERNGVASGYIAHLAFDNRSIPGMSGTEADPRAKTSERRSFGVRALLKLSVPFVSSVRRETGIDTTRRIASVAERGF